MIETKIDELIAALNKNTETTLALLQAGAATDSVAPKKGKPKLEVVADPEPEAGSVPDEGLTDAPEPEETETPTKVATKPTPNDTPNVPSATPPSPGQPAAGEHVDVDEVIAEINATVKGKLLKAEDPEVVKTKWSDIRKAYGVDRIADLRNNPSALLAALKQAKAL